MKGIQKTVFLSGVVVALIYFIYVLSFSTGWALGEPLGDFFLNAQIVNKLLFKWAIYTIAFGLLLIVFQTHVNRNIYIPNYILIVLFCGSLFGSAIKTIELLPSLKAQYLELDEVYLTLITAINDTSISTKIFDYGIIISVIMIIWAFLILSFTIFKTVLQIKRAKLKKASRVEVAYGNQEL